MLPQRAMQRVNRTGLTRRTWGAQAALWAVAAGRLVMASAPLAVYAAEVCVP